MEQSKRQKQVGQLVMEEMSQIFQKEGINVVEGGMVSITKVRMTPDLLEAKIYLSFYKIARPQELIEDIRGRTPIWRNLLGQQVRNQLRRVPELVFYIDDTLEYADKMEALFRKIEEEKSQGEDPATKA